MILRHLRRENSMVSYMTGFSSPTLKPRWRSREPISTCAQDSQAQVCVRCALHDAEESLRAVDRRMMFGRAPCVRADRLQTRRKRVRERAAHAWSTPSRGAPFRGRRRPAVALVGTAITMSEPSAPALSIETSGDIKARAPVHVRAKLDALFFELS